METLRSETRPTAKPETVSGNYFDHIPYNTEYSQENKNGERNKPYKKTVKSDFIKPAIPKIIDANKYEIPAISN